VNKVCVIGASGKLGQYMVQHALDRGFEVTCVCREKSVPKLNRFIGRITVFPGPTNDESVIREAVRDCDGVLTVLVPWGMNHYASGTARAVLYHARPDARLVFSCGWHISRDNRDVYALRFKLMVRLFEKIARWLRIADLSDQEAACAMIFASDKAWTVVRASDLEEGPSQGMPIWRRHVGDPALKRNILRRIDFALFMVAALENDELIHEAPAIVGRTPS